MYVCTQTRLYKYVHFNMLSELKQIVHNHDNFGVLRDIFIQKYSLNKSKPG